MAIVPAATTPAVESPQEELSERSETPAETGKPRPKSQSRIAARRGRPPGQKSGDAADKEKVTLRLNKELIDDYRDWSWEERCQLGELVERALSQYRKHRRQKASNA